ncbi:hypothetical protein MtrunA17_Chr7g0239051 [Medicago truncatula]|uniref:Uncharacterized protein n=1 Tax=Medicago truncatula TaxID=3880 RepID=A0A072TZV8_MEDTR|nr:uncharacterized protein LOC25498519 [Medicago truncatula]KEH22927.1 hypothetical protein MTR_7g062520 [Medicago truncatula]RHN46146.1 hypothetical protein MtrunA17_Chr7g0239051 [Medicago truncatula]
MKISTNIFLLLHKTLHRSNTTNNNPNHYKQHINHQIKTNIAKIDTIIKSFLLSPSPSQDLAAIESMPLALENVVNVVFYGSNDMAAEDAEVQLELCRKFEGFLVSFPDLADEF